MNNEQKNTQELSKLTQQSQNVPQVAPAVKSFDSYFSIEHQSMIAAKYRSKYSELEQQAHKNEFPEFAGNQFTLYVLAETQIEARKAVFSANRSILLNSLIGAMSNYTPTEEGKPLTELKITLNKAADMQLAAVAENVVEEVFRSELLKAYAKLLKQAAKTGADTETARAKFYHASRAFDVVPNSIW